MTPRLGAQLTLLSDDATEARRAASRAPLRRVARPASSADVVEAIDGQPPASAQRREALHRRLLGVFDILAVTTTLLIVLDVIGKHHTALLALVGMPFVVFPFKIAGLYDRDELRLVHSTLDEAPALITQTALFALSVTILQSVLLQGVLGGDQIAGLWLGAFVAIVTGRVFARWLAGRLSPPERCLVIGEQELAHRIRERLASSTARATVVASLPLAIEDIEHLGGAQAIRDVVHHLDVHRIVVAPSTAEPTGVDGLIRLAKAAGVHVSILPRMFEAVGSSVEFDDVNGMTMLGVRRFGLSRSSRLVKRAFDLVAASIGLLLVAPLMGAISFAVRVDSRGPVFFRQVRVGRGGRHFVMLKFRSMVTDAEFKKDELQVHNEFGSGLFKITNDPRTTRVGAFLRRASLDELPQLFNVVRGEMSLVGPRPLVVDEDAHVVGLDRSRLHLTPGMTGPWQVLGTRVPMQEMVGIDYLYVANWTLWLDLKILLRTVSPVVRRTNR